MKRYVSEFIGTFALVFAGTGAIVINDFSNRAIAHLGIALSFGLVIMVIIYAVGDISGAHLHPWSRRKSILKKATMIRKHI